MNLTGRQLQDLRDLIVEAFTLSQFDQMLRFRLDKKRENIALGEDFKDIAFRVIEEADSEGWLEQLTEALSQERPQSKGKLDGILRPSSPIKISERLSDFLQNRRLGRYGVLIGLLLALGAGAFGVWYVLDRGRREREAQFLDQTKDVAALNLDELEGWINYGRELSARSKPPPQILLETRTESLMRRLWVARAENVLRLIESGAQGILDIFRQLLESVPDLPADVEVAVLKQRLETERQRLLERGLDPEPVDPRPPDEARPTLPLCRDAVEVPSGWERLSEEPNRELIASASRNTAALRVGGKLVAGAFRVTETVVLTVNFALTQMVDQPKPGVWTIRPDTVFVDFGSDACDPVERLVPVTGVLFMSGPGDLHLAALRIGSGPPPFTPLALSAEVPREDDTVFVVGFPKGVKSLMPGRFLQALDGVTNPDTPNSLTYDATTGGGSAGGPVVDLQSRSVVGIHWGRTLGPGGAGLADPIPEILGDWAANLGILMMKPAR